VRTKLFETSLPFQSLQRREIPIHGPYHATHLYSFSDVDEIISEEIADCFVKYSLVHPLMGLSLPSMPTSTLGLFKQSVFEVLAHQVHWDTLVKNCVSEVRSSSVPSVRVLAMGPTALSNSLISALKVGGGLNLTLGDGVSWFSQNKIPKSVPGDMRNAKIAIIGMAGRFPNAADHEAFWQLLEQGLDVHREVSILLSRFEFETNLIRSLLIGLMRKHITTPLKKAKT
jgi:hypothetical protein